MPASAIASAITSLTVSVSNPVIGGGGGTSAALPLVVNAGGIPTPTISSVSPSSVTVGYAAPLTITVNGANFAPTSTVSLNSVALAAASVSVVDATQLTVSAPALGAGPVSLTVTNLSNGVGIVFTALEFTDIVPMTVTITNIRNGGGTFDAVITYGITHRNVSRHSTDRPHRAATSGRDQRGIQARSGGRGDRRLRHDRRATADFARVRPSDHAEHLL